MKRSAILSLLLALAACGDVNAPSDRWEEPEEITYASALNVDLAGMNKSPTGLYWQDLVVGTGLTAGVLDSVRVHYTGWLPDGSMFETSRDNNVPIKFRVADGFVIAGLDEGIVGMQVGGRRKLVIPPELGYGALRNGPIPPLSTLIFDVELVWVKD